MAGKTFPGIGDLEDEAPPLDPADAADSGGYARAYSGPTVVDEQKVEAGLQKLRSLDAPPGPLTGITKAVVDALETDRVTPPVPPNPMDLVAKVGADLQRETTVGRSVTGPLPGQQAPAPAFDDRALRGTLFGHDIHLPELNLPVPEEPPVRALAVIERGQETSNEVAVYEPALSAPPPRDAPTYPSPERPHRRGDTLFDGGSSMRPTREGAHRRGDTLFDGGPSLRPARDKKVARLAVGGAALAALVVVAWIWVHSNGEGFQTESPRPPVVSAPAVPAPPSSLAATPAAPPAPAPPAAEAPASPAPASKAPAPSPPPSETAPAPPPRAPKPVAAAKPVHAPASTDDDETEAAPPRPHRVRAASARSERKHTAGAEAKDDGTDSSDTPAAKPAKLKRNVEDDPDATMAPSIE